MRLKQLIWEIKDPGPKFVEVDKNYSLEFVKILKSNRSSILSSSPTDLDTASPSEIVELCHKLNSVFDRHKNKFPCKIFFSDTDSKSWKIKGYSKILKNPCFSTCHFADKNTTFYEKECHIVLEITKNFIDYLRSEDYMILQLNVSKGLGHEIIHYNQHYKMGDYSSHIMSYYDEKSVNSRYARSMSHPDIDNLIKRWTAGHKDNPEERDKFCRGYMCCSIELAPQAFSCVSDVIFYEKIKNPKLSNEELKHRSIKAIENEQAFKSRIFKIFFNVAKDVSPRKYSQFHQMCVDYANCDVLYDFVD